MKSSLLALSLSALTLGVANADTPADVLGVGKAISDTSRAGGEIANSFRDAALQVNEAVERSFLKAMDAAHHHVDQEADNVLAKLGYLTSRLEADQDVTFVQMQQAMVSASALVSRIPGADHELAVNFYWPRVIVPSTDDDVSINIIGPGISNVQTTLTSDAKSAYAAKVSDNEYDIHVSKSALLGDAHKSKINMFHINYSVSNSHWYNPFSWFSTEQRQRDITVRRLPDIPAYIKVTAHVPDWERSVRGPITVGGRGKDKPYPIGVAITPLDQENGWVLDKEAQAKGHFDDNGGDGSGGSSCTGYDPNSFTDKSFIFYLQHGSEGRSDAHQNCRVWIYMKKRKYVETALPPIDLSWKKDVQIKLPGGATKYSAIMTLYDSTEYAISDGQPHVPYKLFNLMQENDSLVIRPLPQRDF